MEVSLASPGGGRGLEKRTRHRNPEHTSHELPTATSATAATTTAATTTATAENDDSSNSDSDSSYSSDNGDSSNNSSNNDSSDNDSSDNDSMVYLGLFRISVVCALYRVVSDCIGLYRIVKFANRDFSARVTRCPSRIEFCTAITLENGVTRVFVFIWV